LIIQKVRRSVLFKIISTEQTHLTQMEFCSNVTVCFRTT